MNKTVAQRLLAMPEPCTSKQQGVLKLTEIAATQIFPFASFEQIPHALLRIELGCIGRQTFQGNACSSTSRQKVFDRLAVMDRGTIPDDQQFPGNLAQKLLKISAPHPLPCRSDLACA